jgi:hypothetical protein
VSVSDGPVDERGAVCAHEARVIEDDEKRYGLGVLHVWACERCWVVEGGGEAVEDVWAWVVFLGEV